MGITINMLTDISTSAAITSSRTSILLHMLTIKFNFFCWHIPPLLCGDQLIAPEFTSLAQSSSLHRLSYMATPLISCSNFKRSKKKPQFQWGFKNTSPGGAIVCQESAAHTYRNVATYFKRNIFYINSVVGLHFIAHFYMWSCLGFWKDKFKFNFPCEGWYFKGSRLCRVEKKAARGTKETALLKHPK